MRPKVSVILPVYNAETTLERTVLSIKNQTLQNWELLLIDDASNDGTKNLLQRFASEDKRIRPIFISKNSGGPAGPRNMGIKMAVGDYLAFICQHGEWLPEKLEIQLDLFEKSADPLLAVVACEDVRTSRMVSVPRAISGDSVLSKMPIYFSSVVIKKQIVQNCGFIDENISFADDWDLLCRIALAGYHFIVAPQRALKRNNTEESLTSRKHCAKMQRDMDQILQKYILYYTSNPFHLTRRLFFDAYIYMNWGDIKSARNRIIKAIRSYPIYPPPYFLLILSFLPEKIYLFIFYLRWILLRLLSRLLA